MFLLALDTKHANYFLGKQAFSHIGHFEKHYMDLKYLATTA